MEESNTLIYKVIGLDEARPPLIQTRPCIDLFFELNEAAPKAWCDEFQASVGKPQFSIKIDPEIGLHVETWVRTPDQISKSLDMVKAIVSQANDAYKRRLEAESKVVTTEDGTIVVTPEQLKLNQVVDQLIFED